MSTSIKNKAIARERQRAHERKANRSGYTSRNYWLYVLFVWLVLPAGTLLSVFTESFNYYHTWAASFDESWRWIPVLFLAAITNALVIMLGKGCVDDVQDAVLSGKAFDKATFALKLLIFCGAFYWSVSNSLEGAPLLRTHLQEKRQPVAALLRNPDDVDTAYADRRDQQLSIIAAAKKTTWKGNITRDAMRAMRTAQAELTKLDAAIATERAEVTAKNEATTLAYEEELNQSANKATTIAGVGQLIMILSVMFIGLWYTGVEDDLDEEDDLGADAGAKGRTKGSESRTIGFHPAPPATAAAPYSDVGGHEGLPEGRRKIGFHHRSRSEADTSAAATRSDKRSDSQAESLEAASRLNSWRTNKRNLDSVKKRTSETAKDHAKRLKEAMEYEEKMLAQMGLRIELQESPRRRYVLVPI